MKGTPFINWWRDLNVALVIRGEPEALYGEALQWARWTETNRPAMTAVDERLVNRVINERKPL
jgi:hypothetical protein